jgi:hypothetical protein
MIPQVYAYQTSPYASQLPGQVGYYATTAPNGHLYAAGNAIYAARPPQIPSHLQLQQQQFHHQLQQQQQQQQQQQHQPLQINLNETNIKSEPMDHNQGGDSSAAQLSSAKSKPYFTNPIPFKMEPAESDELAAAVTKQEDSTALNLVNHLLKDQSILSQLEKVAQSFKRN